MAFGGIVTGLTAATMFMPLAFDAIALAKAIMNVVKAGDSVSETDLENVEIKRQRLIDNAMKSSEDWKSSLISLRAWINQQKAASAEPE